MICLLGCTYMKRCAPHRSMETVKRPLTDGFWRSASLSTDGRLPVCSRKSTMASLALRACNCVWRISRDCPVKSIHKVPVTSMWSSCMEFHRRHRGQASSCVVPSNLPISIRTRFPFYSKASLDRHLPMCRQTDRTISRFLIFCMFNRLSSLQVKKVQSHDCTDHKFGFCLPIARRSCV